MPLCFFSCSKQVVIYLLENGANLDMQDYRGFTALHYAVFGDRIDIIKILLSYGAKITKDKKG